MSRSLSTVTAQLPRPLVNRKIEKLVSDFKTTVDCTAQPKYSWPHIASQNVEIFANNLRGNMTCQ